MNQKLLSKIQEIIKNASNECANLTKDSEENSPVEVGTYLCESLLWDFHYFANIMNIPYETLASFFETTYMHVTGKVPDKSIMDTFEAKIQNQKVDLNLPEINIFSPTSYSKGQN